MSCSHGFSRTWRRLHVFAWLVHCLYGICCDGSEQLLWLCSFLPSNFRFRVWISMLAVTKSKKWSIDITTSDLETTFFTTLYNLKKKKLERAVTNTNDPLSDVDRSDCYMHLTLVRPEMEQKIFRFTKGNATYGFGFMTLTLKTTLSLLFWRFCWTMWVMWHF